MKSSLSILQAALSHSMRVVVSTEATFDGITTDSRSASAGQLFVALRGERFDAHDFLWEVAEKGVAAVLVEQVPPGLTVPAIVVPDTRIALGEIGKYWREKFVLPLIGVTGSNGKTTVKEMIASILTAAFGSDGMMATRGNFNNDIGVPLTLLRLEAAHQAAVVELGMNHPGEIALLSAMAQPTVGLVNNAQREHQEFMESVEAVAKENGAVIHALPDHGVAVFPADDVYTGLWREVAARQGKRRMISFGLSADADVSCTFEVKNFGSELKVCAGEQRFSIKLEAAGLHNVRNALAAIACAVAIGVEVAAIIRGLESFSPVSGRLQRKIAGNGATVIDDTYNANPDSVRAAIDVLAQAPALRILVLGDMGEVGADGIKFHREIGLYAHEKGIEALLTLGTLAGDSNAAFGKNSQHFSDVDALIEALDAGLTPTTTVLVKGSRFMKMERVVQHLIADNKTGDKAGDKAGNKAGNTPPNLKGIH